METLEPGHDYLVNVLDTPHDEPVQLQRITFVKRIGPRYPGNHGRHSGTTSQELLRVLANRARYVQKQIPCWQTRLSIFLLRLVIWLYEHRAAKRHRRRVPSMYDAEFAWTCRICGHVGCRGMCRA